MGVYNSSMDLSVLKIFVEVIRQGSFAAVARERNLDPSSVSRAIAGLEEELGIPLLSLSEYNKKKDRKIKR
jgi:DNA-binding transcriptional LysR family regulator